MAVTKGGTGGGGLCKDARCKARARTHNLRHFSRHHMKHCRAQRMASATGLWAFFACF